MPLPVNFIESEHWNTSDPGTGGVGGATGDVATAVIAETLDAVFPVNVSDFIGQPNRTRFQKLFIVNTGIIAGDNISNLKVFFNDVKFPDQISFAFEKVAGDSGDHPTGFPTGYGTGDFSTPLGIIDAVASPDTGLDTGATLGIWLFQSVPANLPAETGATATLGVVGELP